MIRQGDVLLVPCEEPATKIPATDDAGEPLAGLVVAGNRTGHAHRLAARVYAAPTSRGTGQVLVLERPTVLRHVKEDGTQADHQPIEVPAGWWEVIVQREHRPEQSPTGRWD